MGVTRALKDMCDLKRAQMRCEGYENLTGGPKRGMCYKDLQGAAKEGLKKVNLHTLRILKVTAPVTFGFSRQKGLLLLSSCYFRMFKKHLCSNSHFRQSKSITNEIKRSI